VVFLNKKNSPLCGAKGKGSKQEERVVKKSFEFFFAASTSIHSLFFSSAPSQREWVEKMKSDKVVWSRKKNHRPLMKVHFFCRKSKQKKPKSLIERMKKKSFVAFCNNPKFKKSKKERKKISEFFLCQQ
jgi:hypothetical protein